jgi:hypothetical protein
MSMRVGASVRHLVAGAADQLAQPLGARLIFIARALVVKSV